MQKSIVWEGLYYTTEEQCSINYLDGAIVVRSELEGWALTTPVYMEYVLRLGADWKVTELDINITVGETNYAYLLFRDADAKWTDANGTTYPEFSGCDFIDISLTPFTNSLPINGLQWHEDEKQQVEVLYMDVLANHLRKDTQHYTRTGLHNYTFENDGGNFIANITVDDDGLVTNYPELFEMLNQYNPMDTVQQIEALEARLIAAMKASNIPELHELLADGLIFTNQNGHLVNKADDINMHQSGKLEIYSLETSAQLITVYDDVAVVSVVQDLGGDFDGHTYAGIFRYTRVWTLLDGKWQVIAGHVSQLVS